MITHIAIVTVRRPDQSTVQYNVDLGSTALTQQEITELCNLKNKTVTQDDVVSAGVQTTVLNYIRNVETGLAIHISDMKFGKLNEVFGAEIHNVQNIGTTQSEPDFYINPGLSVATLTNTGELRIFRLGDRDTFTMGMVGIGRAIASKPASEVVDEVQLLNNLLILNANLVWITHAFMLDYINYLIANTGNLQSVKAIYADRY